MKYNPKIHNRKSIRLKGYDYSQAGLYFITLCCQNREHFFGEIIERKMILNDAGRLIEKEWRKIPERFKNVELDEYVIMPNHFHAILNIVGATLVVAPNETAPANTQNNKTLGEIIGAFKSITTNEYIKNVKSNNWKRFDGKLWQRNYWEHIIRNEKAHSNISDYIRNNPKKWEDDTLNLKG